jgi:hypothetical protein
MNLNPKTHATCSEDSPAQPSGVQQQVQPRSSGPDGYSNDHQAKRESGEDTDIYALINPLLIKSRWSATRSRS